MESRFRCRYRTGVQAGEQGRPADTRKSQWELYPVGTAQVHFGVGIGEPRATRSPTLCRIPDYAECDHRQGIESAFAIRRFGIVRLSLGAVILGECKLSLIPIFSTGFAWGHWPLVSTAI